jgi:peptidoglycan hydrolase CwlO-like protein
MAVFVASILAPGGIRAQQSDLRREILESQRRLEEIRTERARLERDMEDVRIRVRDASVDLANVERRLSASRSVLAEIQFQSDAVAEQVQRTTVELLQTRERMAEGKAILSRRLRDIYKTGPLHTVRVLLGASSFTDLLNRYRYLEKVALFDRRLVESVAGLEAELAVQSRELQQRLAELGSLRLTRLGEVAELRAVEAERQTALAEYRSRERRTLTRLDQLEADEGRMTGVIADLDAPPRRPRRGASPPPVPG